MLAGAVVTGLAACCALAAAPIPAASAAGTAATAFFIGSDGGLYSYGKAADGSVIPAARLSPAGLAPPGAPVGVAHALDGTTVSVVMGRNGAPFMGCFPQPPVQMAAGGLGQPGGPVALAQAGQTMMAAFASSNGGVSVALLVPNPCPPSTAHIVLMTPDPQATIPDGGQVTAIGLPDGEFGAYWFDSSGAGHSLWRFASGAWQDTVILPPGTAKPGGGIAVLPAPGTAGAVWVFYPGHDGRVYRVTQVPGSPVSEPSPHPWSQATDVPDGALVSVASSGGNTEVAYVASNGAVTALQADAQGNWLGAITVSGQGFAAPGSSVASTVAGDEWDDWCGTRWPGWWDHHWWGPGPPNPPWWNAASNTVLTSPGMNYAAIGG